MNQRLVAAFNGPVACSVSHRRLSLIGSERGSGRPIQVYLGGFDGRVPTASCADAELYLVSTNGKSSWRLVAGNLDQLLPARSLHVHRPAADRFFAAVPGVEPTLSSRLGWALLLTLLRVPGAGRILKFLRSR
jgi:hypothetical protein